MMTTIRALALSFFLLTVPAVSPAAEDTHGPMMSGDEHSKQGAETAKQSKPQGSRDELEALRKRVAELEALKPTLTTIMPDFAERFHVMHYAGDAGDWAVAQHELAEMQRMVRVAGVIDAEKGALMKGFLTKNFNELAAAIEHGNRESFDKALAQTVANCNACHAAAGSAFIRVSLDVAESLTLRHPHAFVRERVRGEHMHKH